MQVGLTSSSLATGGAHSAAVSSSTVASTQAVRQKLPATASEYPASPLITTRPQRYSVQLNDQLTTLQQADHYLGQLEQQLLDYRHSQRKGGQAQSTALMQMLDKRAALRRRGGPRVTTSVAGRSAGDLPLAGSGESGTQSHAGNAHVQCL